MQAPVIYYDPTSEPSRAIRWLCLEAGLPHTIECVWLTRLEHLSDGYQKINPMHQVPSMVHGDFSLTEAAAIMFYLAEFNDCGGEWFGEDLRRRSTISKFMSWYHTNLRKVLTLDYFLPALLMPAYIGVPKPPESEIDSAKKALRVMLAQLNTMLSANPYLAGDRISAADLLFASEIAALEIDPQFDEYLSEFDSLNSWLSTLQAMPTYIETHAAWSHVVPLIKETKSLPGADPGWVADACESVSTVDTTHS